ncbi:MAG: VOC family protein [Bifidobacteriaceae bacterium]|nr:VOC family protein [Bifidobacteriaceae bacterium]MCI1979469.1 VOC family protein [Bifidobacteriaceae bacterium]
MIDHITVTVRRLATSIDFYKVALKPLGYVEKVRHGRTIGLGMDDGTPRADFYISPTTDTSATTETESSTPLTHIAFRARSQEEVQAFYEAALAAGGRDNGAPGFRDYHPGYYAAFVLDPDGNNVEAVVEWSQPETPQRPR